MSVKKDDINLNNILDKAAGKTGPEPKKKGTPKTEPELASILDAAATGSLKKKDTPKTSTPSSEGSAAGAVPGTTSTTPLKWEDNPLNPAKAIADNEAARDKTPEILFKPEDQQKLNSLLLKHGVAPTSTSVPKPSELMPGGMYLKSGPKTAMEVEYDNAVNVEKSLTSLLDAYRIARQGQRASRKSKQEEEAEKDLLEVQNLKRKAATELVVNGDKEIEINQRTNEIGNSFNQFMSDLIKLNQPIKGVQYKVKETEDKLKKVPSQFLTGVNMLRLTEPAEYERVQDAIINGLPISASQEAKITNLGLNIEEAKLKRDLLKSPVTPQERQKFDEIGKVLNTIKPDIDKYEAMVKAKQPLSSAQAADYQNKIKQYNETVTQSKPLIDKVNGIDGAFAKKANQLLEARRKNLIDNPEVLRAFIADGVATKLDELGKIGQAGGSVDSKKMVSDFMFGHTWSYSPEQIKWASEQYLKQQGIDPNTPQAQAAIKFLQDNEGVMIGENSIAKAGGFRELGEGLIEPIVGISKSIKDISRSSNTVYAESQSAGNVDIAKKRLESEDTGVRSVVNDVLKGTGQFATQAAIMYGTSGVVGAFAEGVMGKAGVQLLADAKAANMRTVIPFDDATVNIAAGKFLYNIKDPLSVFTTSYAMSYDGNLKAALSYTSDNALAKRAAAFNASMEGATELFLSPLDIARGIYSKFSKNQTKDLLKILSDKSLKNDPSALKEYVGKFVKGVAGTAKVAGAEIGEEMVTQISDYVTNMYLNPDADSFKNRDLKKELMTTAYQTGLSMAVPALLNGIGAAKANSFSKGSLLVAAQNRQAMVDDLNRSVAQRAISQEYANQQIQLINTAAVANAEVPKKASGADLNTTEKANYIWSRVTEAYMEKQMSSTTDAAAKEIWKDKIAKQQEYRKQIIGLSEEQPEVPEYTIDDKPVSKDELLATAEKEPDDHNFVVSGDEETQQVIRKIGGIDDVVAEEEKPEETKLPSDTELINQVKEKAVKNYEEPSISELKEQALQAPDSFKNQFDDEELTINLIAKNSTEQIENAIKYQEERLNDSSIDVAGIVGIDKHIQLLELGLEKNKKFVQDVVVDEGVVEPTQEQLLQDVKDKNFVTFTYKSDAEVPEIFKDKISSRGETNGEPIIRVTIEKSLADYYLAKEQSLSTKPEIASSEIESKTTELGNKLPEFQNNTRTQATKDLIKWAEDIFDTKFEGDFDKGEYVSFFNSLGDKGYEAARFLQNPKKALSILKESPVYQGKLKEQAKSKPEIKKPLSKLEQLKAKKGIKSQPYILADGSMFKATPVEIEGLEHLDTVIGKEDTGMNWKVVEVATGGTLSEGFSKEEAIDNAKAEQNLKRVTYEAINNTANMNVKILNKSDKYEKYLADKKAVREAKPVNQEEKVKFVLADNEEGASIKEIAEKTGILEPNVRRILGVGAKQGKFERVRKGVYVLKTEEGKQIAWVEAGDAKETLQRMADEGKKFDSVFLDPAYFSRALIGGNRGIKKWNFIMPGDFASVMQSVSRLVDDNNHVYVMLSGAKTAQTDMEKYIDGVVDAGFKLIGEGGFTKTFADGKPVTNVRGEEAKPERLMLFTKSGKAKSGEIPISLNFRFVRPNVRTGYQTEKPKELLRALIKQSTFEGEEILDPFAGSGVTGEQAIESGRKVTLIEKKEEVVEDIIKPRLAKSTLQEDSIHVLSKSLDEIGTPSVNDKLANLNETLNGMKDVKGVITLVPFKDGYIVAEGGYGTMDIIKPFSNVSSYEIGFNYYTTYYWVNSKVIPALKNAIKEGNKFGPKSFIETNKDFQVTEIYNSETQTENKIVKNINLDKEIGLLSAEFLEINKPEVTGSQRIKIVDVPLSSISTDTSSFQNRETEFSQESVDKILKAVQEDTFTWTEFDPITLWKNNGQLYVLSGHSRFEAFKQLTIRGYAGFDTIPAEIFEGSKEEAIAIALRSNTLSTKETPIERANYYREARLHGTSSRAILNEAKEYEGRNAPTIIALSYLNPNGKAIAFLKALGQEGDTKSKANSLQMARWTGEVRQQFPQLTNEHENEIFDWLKDGAYNKIKNLPEISSRINNVVSAFDFDSESPLNLAHKGTKTYVDEQYEQQLADKEKQIKDQQKLIADKSTKYNEAKLSPQQVAEKLVPDNAILSRLQQDYIKLKEKKGAISEANKGILSLFDNIQTEIDNGNITEQQVEAFINNTGQIEEDDTIIEDIERNAESPDDAGTAIQEGNELIAGEDVNAKRIERAEEKLATKIKSLEKEKTSRLNEITKPVIDMNTMLITDLFTLAGTTESNRQKYDEIKNQLFGLKNLIDCLFS